RAGTAVDAVVKCGTQGSRLDGHANRIVGGRARRRHHRGGGREGEGVGDNPRRFVTSAEAASAEIAAENRITISPQLGYFCGLGLIRGEVNFCTHCLGGYL